MAKYNVNKSVDLRHFIVKAYLENIKCKLQHQNVDGENDIYFRRIVSTFYICLNA